MKTSRIIFNRLTIASPGLTPLAVLLATALFLMCGTAMAQEDPDSVQPDLKAGPEDSGDDEANDAGDKSSDEDDASSGAENDGDKAGANEKRPPKPRARKTRARIDAKTAKAVTALIEKHVKHANEGDLEAYLNDFIPKHPRRDVIEAFAKRVLEKHGPSIELLHMEVVRAGKRRGRVRVLQETRYKKAVAGGAKETVDLAEITYHCRLTNNGWRIESTSRKRLTRAQVDERIAEDEESD